MKRRNRIQSIPRHSIYGLFPYIDPSNNTPTDRSNLERANQVLSEKNLTDRHRHRPKTPPIQPLQPSPSPRVFRSNTGLRSRGASRGYARRGAPATAAPRPADPGGSGFQVPNPTEADRGAPRGRGGHVGEDMGPGCGGSLWCQVTWM